ncbi:RNA-binding domain-containing protein [Calocera cornea HHB12733]|uniref:RNA-binding domain-containing protein n=1 Tax=Calocera cornea HHB12733 TaxID=1353952 RepID=A0A165JXC6_9BASI|nr:RNA-binding domain-containing protein [Calocera cornea HHB12733]
MSEPTAPAPQLASTTTDAVPAPADSVKPQESGEAKVNGAAVEEPAGPKVFAGNLSYGTTEESLRGFFKEFEADIVHVNLVHRGPRPAGYAFVTFPALERAQAAVTALNDKELDGRKVAIEIAKPAEEKERKPKKKKARATPKRVGEVTEEEAEGEGAETAPGTEARIDVPDTVAADAKDAPKRKKTARKPKPRRVKSNADAAAPGETDPAEGAKPEATKAEPGAEKTPRVKKPRAPPRPRRPAGEDPVGSLSPNMLFVANLPFTVTDQTLAELFTSANVNVVSARVVRRRWPPRRSKGYGFVDVGDEAAQKKGIEAVNGKEIEGREVAVKVAVNTQLEDAEKEEKEGAAQEGSSPEATVLAT